MSDRQDKFNVRATTTTIVNCRAADLARAAKKASSRNAAYSQVSKSSLLEVIPEA